MRGMSKPVNSNRTRGCTVRIITLDFETYWDSKEYTLSKTGPISYIRDERFYAQLLSVRVDREAVQVFEHSDIPHVVANLGLERPDTVTVGHNVSGFDALILSEIYGIRPRNIWDTIPMARWCGIARLTRENHKYLTAWLGHGVKQDGTVVSDGKRTREDFSPEEWAFFKQYCADDTQQCSENFFSMLPYMTSDALKFMSITARMATEPAFTLSRPELAAYIIELEAKEEQARKEISSLYHFDTPEEMLKAIRSADTFASMLRAFGCEVPMKVSEKRTEAKRNELLAARDKALETGESITDIQAQLDDPTKYTVMIPALSKTDLEFLDLLDHPDPRVSQLVALRLEHNSSGQMSRARRFYDLSQTGKPLPFMLKTFFAHTGRYGAGNSEGASDSTNMQNISKRDPAMLALRKAIHVPDGCKVVAADSSQIEARILAYLAGETELLQQFRDGRDPYSELAESIFGVPWKEIKAGAKSGDKLMKNYRNVGKTGILSAGYGTGYQKFSDTLMRQGIKLSEDPDVHLELAKHAHTIYRMKHPNIVSFWGKCQNVIEAMASGGRGVFAGPEHCTLEFGAMPVLGASNPVPSIKMPSGYTIRYPGLRAEKVEGSRRLQYYFDRVKGKSTIKTKVYGGAITENCIAKGTLVYTDSGWKPIETIRLSDKVYDGIDFVSHSGLVQKGIQPCIVVDGVWMTSDHKLLSEDGWYAAKETDVRRLRRCELRLPKRRRSNSPQLQGHNWAALRETRSRAAIIFASWKMALANALRLRSYSGEGNLRANQSYRSRNDAYVSGLRESFFEEQDAYSWYDGSSALRSMALYEAALSMPHISSISSVWRSGYNYLRQMERLVREFLCRYGAYIQTRSCNRPYRQQWELLSGELPLDNIQSKWTQSCRSICRHRYSRAFQCYRHISVDHRVQDTARMANRNVSYSSKLEQRKAETFQITGTVSKEVFDILDCGPRHRFVIAGAHGPIIAHNCCQSLAFQLLMWQACRMAEHGIHLHGNIHDSFAAIVPDSEVEHTIQVMTECMSSVPEWLQGFPVACEAEVGIDFTVV